ncbi:MAG TPA: hypothetical protein VLS89_19350, partial [Candidatus Nanopelagicales bacterium]|nr:hypothetical protein [Candidatus Nanopelagicales bacterium]
SPGDRDAAVKAIDALAAEPTPRGSVALHGRAEGHVQRPVGRIRLVYRVRGPTVVLVAVTSGPI